MPAKNNAPAVATKAEKKSSTASDKATPAKTTVKAAVKDAVHRCLMGCSPLGTVDEVRLGISVAPLDGVAGWLFSLLPVDSDQGIQ